MIGLHLLLERRKYLHCIAKVLHVSPAFLCQLSEASSCTLEVISLNTIHNCLKLLQSKVLQRTSTKSVNHHIELGICFIEELLILLVLGIEFEKIP